MSRVVVIGATGHIGTYLVPRLVAGGHEVIAVSRGARGPYQASPRWSAVTTVTADREAEDARQHQRQRQARHITASLDRNNALPRNAHRLRQVLLRPVACRAEIFHTILHG